MRLRHRGHVGGGGAAPYQGTKHKSRQKLWPQGSEAGRARVRAQIEHSKWSSIDGLRQTGGGTYSPPGRGIGDTIFNLKFKVVTPPLP